MRFFLKFIHAAVGLTKLTVEGRTEPLGLDETVPRFGWQIVADERNVKQEGYQLQISTVAGGNGNVWDNGSLSDVSPAYWRLYNGNITWPAALLFGMEMMRLQYGDERPMREHADNVKRFLVFAKKKSGRDGLITYDRSKTRRYLKKAREI